MLSARLTGLTAHPRAVVAAAAKAAVMSTKRKAVSICTHSGTFHCDEALGCWMLKHTDQFAGGSVVGSVTAHLACRVLLSWQQQVPTCCSCCCCCPCRPCPAAPMHPTPPQTAALCAAVIQLCGQTVMWWWMLGACMSLTTTALTTISEDSQRCLVTASTPSCPAQVSAAAEEPSVQGLRVWVPLPLSHTTAVTLALVTAADVPQLKGLFCYCSCLETCVQGYPMHACGVCITCCV